MLTRKIHRALLTSVLAQIFSEAKPNPAIIAPQNLRDAYSAATGSPSKLKQDISHTPLEFESKHKKPDDSCAVCYEDMEGEMEELEQTLVWCETCNKVCSPRGTAHRSP